ncbi:hypothetical protein HPB50_013882 [Hyalomma asiaticum]|uniref:Uncharacterized protein n=1 Tax=Hyalomma asiaticum TaxID=266040 RepID=A0ACB7SE84_HYAAI|nr:hypothetical protein HPB50_013882 [Hyalomma asiaticum]
MVKKTAKCSGCGAAVKMEVCAEEKAEEADAKCRQCEIEEKMEKMMAAQSGLMDRIAELENALAKERVKTQAMGERLSLEVPSSYWSKHSFPGHAGVVYCTAVLTSNAEVLSEKVVMFSESQCAAYCKVLARGVLIKSEGPVHSKTEAEDELRKTDRMQLCAGAMRRDEYDEALFTTKLRDHVLMRQGLYFSTKCLGQVPKQGMLCVSCRYLRRALLTRRSRVQRRNTKARLNIAQKLKTAVRRTKRLSTRLYDARESLVKLQQQAAAKNADVLQDRLGACLSISKKLLNTALQQLKSNLMVFDTARAGYSTAS